MSADTPASRSLYRFVWVQDFAARLVELGAPTSVDALVQLGKELFQTGKERDAVRAAETVWSEWPTQP